MAEGDGYGRQRPETANSTYNAVTFAIEQAISKLDTVKIVQVIAVDTDAKTVQVTPLVKQIDGNNQVTDEGTVYGIPYMTWQYGTSAILADPAVDDIGLLLCSDRDISAVKESHAPAQPGSERSYDRADGVYLGGLFKDEDDIEQYVKFTDTGMELADKNGNSLVSSPTGWLFTGNVTFAGALVAQGNLELGGNITNEGGGTYDGTFTTSGDVVAGNISLKTHRHNGVQIGGGTSGGPVV